MKMHTHPVRTTFKDREKTWCGPQIREYINVKTTQSGELIEKEYELQTKVGFFHENFRNFLERRVLKIHTACE